jgi:hypothetical protein
LIKIFVEEDVEVEAEPDGLAKQLRKLGEFMLYFHKEIFKK